MDRSVVDFAFHVHLIALCPLKITGYTHTNSCSALMKTTLCKGFKHNEINTIYTLISS